MPKQDYLTRMVEEMAKAIGKAIFKLNDNLQHNTLNIENNIKNDLINGADLNIDQLLKLNDEDLIVALKEKGIIKSNIELFSKLLFNFAIYNHTELKKLYLQKAKFALNHLNETDKTFSFEREKLIRDIEHTLNCI